MPWWFKMKNNKITDIRQMTEAHLAGEMAPWRSYLPHNPRAGSRFFRARHQGCRSGSPDIQISSNRLCAETAGHTTYIQRSAGDPKRSIDMAGLLGNIFHGIGTGITDPADTMLNARADCLICFRAKPGFPEHFDDRIQWPMPMRHFHNHAPRRQRRV